MTDLSTDFVWCFASFPGRHRPTELPHAWPAGFMGGTLYLSAVDPVLCERWLDYIQVGCPANGQGEVVGVCARDFEYQFVFILFFNFQESSLASRCPRPGDSHRELLRVALRPTGSWLPVRRTGQPDLPTKGVAALPLQPELLVHF